MDKVKIRHRFAFRLILYITVPAVFVFVAVLTYSYNVSKNALLAEVENEAAILASSILHKIEDAFWLAEDITRDLSIILECIDDITDKELQSIIKQLVEINPEIYGSTVSFDPAYNKNLLYGPYYYMSKEGVKYVDLSKNYDYQKRDWYAIPKKLGIGVWSEPYYDEGGGETLMVTYSKPCYKYINGKKTFIGVATADVTIDWLVEYFEKMDLSIGSAFLISAKGIVIADKNHPYIPKSILFSLAERRNNDSMKKLWGKMVKGETGFVKYYSEILKKQYYLQYVPFVIKGWTLNVAFPEEELFHDLKVVTMNLFIIQLVGYTLILVLIAVFAYKFTRPLKSLADATKKIGEGDFCVKIPTVFLQDEVGVLSHALSSMQENLATYIANLQEATIAKEKLRKELSVARDIQQSLLPHKFPNIKQIDLYASLIPAKEVGGDLYDFFFIDEKHLCFAIGDVAGKGIPGALFMAVTKTLLRAKLSVTMDIAKVLNVMNKDLCKDNDSCMFVTFFLGILNIETGFLEYCNAGHTPPLIYTVKNGFQYFHTEVPYPPLGIMEDVNYIGNSLKLLPKNIFFLYTDGVTEAMNIESVQFSEEKLLDILTRNKDETVSSIINNVKIAVQRHVSGAIQSDDITMLIFKYRGETS